MAKHAAIGFRGLNVIAVKGIPKPLASDVVPDLAHVLGLHVVKRFQCQQSPCHLSLRFNREPTPGMSSSSTLNKGAGIMCGCHMVTPFGLSCLPAILASCRLAAKPMLQVMKGPTCCANVCLMLQRPSACGSWRWYSSSLHVSSSIDFTASIGNDRFQSRTSAHCARGDRGLAFAAPAQYQGKAAWHLQPSSHS